MSMRLTVTRLAKRLIPAAALAVALHFAPTAAQAAPGLWVVHSNNTTVYLFGTVHMLPVSTHWQSASIEHAMDLSDEIWTEADTSSLPALVRLIRRYGISPAGNLRSVLPKRYRARYDMEMSSAGLSLDTFGHVKPWLAELLLTGGALKHARFGHGVETDLLAFAHHHNKTTPTFETADEQFAILADLPVEAQIRALELQIDGYSGTAGDMNAMVLAWLHGDVDNLDKLSNQKLAATNERYFDDVIVRRNEHFASSIVTRLQAGGVAFVAIGASHLCGSASVLSFLRNYGFKAERVPT
jgi:uncharacterized protein YbaP (TraB family)